MSQTNLILADLKKGRKLTPIDALRDHGVFRLGARIWDLRKRGHEIHSHLVDVGDGKKVAEYRLLKAAS